MGTLSTHVLDTAIGRPAEGLEIVLTQSGEELGRGTTNADGRVGVIGPEQLAPGDYVLTFDTAGYFRASGQVGFYPTVSITFTIVEGAGHYHVPLLLQPYGYATYRGS